VAGERVGNQLRLAHAAGVEAQVHMTTTDLFSGTRLALKAGQQRAQRRQQDGAQPPAPPPMKQPYFHPAALLKNTPWGDLPTGMVSTILRDSRSTMLTVLPKRCVTHMRLPSAVISMQSGP